MLKKKLCIGFATVLAFSMLSVSNPVTLDAAKQCSHQWHINDCFYEDASYSHTFSCRGHGHDGRTETCKVNKKLKTYVYKCKLCKEGKTRQETISVEHTNSHCSAY